jgi:hypothetical protein
MDGRGGRFRLLNITVGLTVSLLGIGAFLVVLAIFDEYLGWDIFSPAVQKVLEGFVLSSVTLASFGATITFVLGIQEVVQSLRRMLEGASAVADRRSAVRQYVWLLASTGLLLALTVGILSRVNDSVQKHRREVFKMIAQDRMRQLQPQLQSAINGQQALEEGVVNPELRTLYRTLERLSFCESATFYLADPKDPAVLWRYPESRNMSGEPGFERIFVAKDDDQAIKLALADDRAWIQQKNSGPGFVWYEVVPGPGGKPRAVLQVYGNENESFREYEAMFTAAKKAR